MALTFGEAYNLSQQSYFHQQVEAAAVKTALAVVAEDAGTAEHAARLKLAFSVLNDPVTWGRRLATASIANAASFSMTPPDSDVEYTVATVLWTKIALAFVTSEV